MNAHKSGNQGQKSTLRSDSDRRDTLGQGAKMRAVGYIRVSTDMQAQFGLSLEAQKEQITNYAKAMGYDLRAMFVEAESAKSMDGRPQYQTMIRDWVDTGRADIIICPGLDRFTRSQRDFVNFSHDYIDSGKVALILIRECINTASPTGKQFLPLLVAFAQLERERTAERVRSTIAYIRSQNAHFGKIPFGYALERIPGSRLNRLVPHPENHKWIGIMAGWHKDGLTFDQIAFRLNEAKVKPSQSQLWTKTSVYDFLVKEKIHIPRSETSDKIYDRDKAFDLAYSLKAEGVSCSAIAEKLNMAGLRPSKASAYRWWSVQELLRSVPIHDRNTALGLAKYMRAQHASLTEICKALTDRGFKPKRGGQWYPQTVKNLIDIKSEVEGGSWLYRRASRVAS